MDKELTIYINTALLISTLNEKIEKLERKLATPEHTKKDLIRHMLLLKSLHNLC